jgi:hypothetical protein
MCIHSFLPETAQVVQQNQRFTDNQQMRPGNSDVRLNEMLKSLPAEPPRQVGNLPPAVVATGPGFAGYGGGGSRRKVFMA